MARKLTAFVLTCCLTLSLSSCRKVIVQTVPVERTPLNLPTIAPLQLEGMTWYIITKENFETILNDAQANGAQPVFFALDDKGYESLSVNMTKIRSYIEQQKTVVAAMKTYYHTPDNPESLTPPMPNKNDDKKAQPQITVVDSAPIDKNAKAPKAEDSKNTTVKPPKAKKIFPSF